MRSGLVDIFRKGNTMSTMTETKGRRTRRSFTDDYKTGAVRLVLDEGKTVGPRRAIWACGVVAPQLRIDEGQDRLTTADVNWRGCAARLRGARRPRSEIPWSLSPHDCVAGWASRELPPGGSARNA